jgi:hypothetical protein
MDFHILNYNNGCHIRWLHSFAHYSQVCMGT